MTTEKEISIWVKTLLLVLEKKTETEKELVFGRLTGILKKRKKEYLLPKIFKKFKSIYLKRKRVEFSFAREQSPIIINKIKEKLSDVFEKEKNIDIKISKDLIAGFRVKTEKFLIKASVKDFLTELKSNY
jgi:F0F1-type ATP synthase delta subunit